MIQVTRQLDAPIPRKTRSVANSIGDIIGDITMLAELQVDLLRADSSESVKKLVVPAVAFVTGVMVFAACFPILLMLIAVALYEYAEFSLTLSVGISAIAGFVVGGFALTIGAWGLKRALSYFERSAKELRQNIKWLKNLKRRDRPMA